MTTINIIIIAFVVFAASRAYLRFRSKSISIKELIFWLTVWAAIIIVTIFPDFTGQLANPLGIGRGADLVFILAILVLFYLVFRLNVKLDQIDKDITELVKKLTLSQKSD